MKNGKPLIVFLFLLGMGGYAYIFLDSEIAEAAQSKKVQQPIIQRDKWSEDTLLSSPDLLYRSKQSVKVKGIYLSGRSAGGEKFNKLLQFVRETELNSMVIDMKEDEGKVTYRSSIPLVKTLQSDQKRFISDIDSIIQTMRDHHIYPIARIVCFKDPLLATRKMDWAMHKTQGGLWRDAQGVLWIDPYRVEVWDYNVQLAKEAAMKGFKEIQFDYVRFPTNGQKVDQEVAFYQPDGKKKKQLIADFLAYARKELEPFHVYISVDVFGLVPSVSDDMGIGQQWEYLSEQADYISPMMYPSHYANGTYGIKVPDAQPYATIVAGLRDAKRKNNLMRQQKKNTAVIRPWYQDFTARWLKNHMTYGSKQVREQIQAGYAVGVDQYLIWDATNTYSKAAWERK
ncbi:putative glycoside hydrolase [Brevibacillus ginsengisoli]|uniref:putative glycoside hydrolase n=1 Tax=Brevibacillus ginsengisoli TaxID=363854 RepID=UPI003CE954D1